MANNLPYVVVWSLLIVYLVIAKYALLSFKIVYFSGQTPPSSIDSSTSADPYQDFTASGTADAEPSRLSMENAVRKLLCCCGNCNIDDFLARGCPTSGGDLRKFPFLDLKHLSGQEKRMLIVRLVVDAGKVKDEFASVVRETRRALQKCVSVDDLQVYVCTLELSRFHANLANVHMLESFESKLCSCSTVSQVFLTLNRVWSWFNHYLLGKLISEFKAVGNDIMQKYKQYLAKFLHPYLQKSIFEVPCDTFGPERLDSFEMLVLKVDESSVESVKAETLSEVLIYTSSVLRIERETLILQSFHKGCFRATFLIATVAVDEVFPLSAACVTALSHFKPKIMSVECREIVTIIHQTKVVVIHVTSLHVCLL